MTLIHAVPSQTLCNCIDLLNLLCTVEADNLSDRSSTGLQVALSMIAEALEHLEQTTRLQTVSEGG